MQLVSYMLAPLALALWSQAVSAAAEDAEDAQLNRYQECFQKMIDANATDNAFMRACLGLEDKGGKGPPKSGGAADEISSADVLAVIRKNSATVRRCYDELVKRQPQAAGQATLDVSVSPKGRVSKVAFHQLTVGDGPFRECLSSEIGKWRFPRPRSGEPAKLRLPFKFAPH